LRGGGRPQICTTSTDCTAYLTVMPIVVFVGSVGDLATLERSVGRDTSLFPPGSFSLFLNFFCPRGLGGMESFTLAVPLRCDGGEFLETW